MIIYFLKAITLSAIFLSVYLLLLQKERMYQFNRFFLLVSLILSLIIPAIILTFENHSQIRESIIVYSNVLNHQTNLTKLDPTLLPFDYLNIFLLSVYFLITTLLIYRFFQNLKHAFALITSSKVVSYQNAKLVLTEDNFIPCSFLNYIFINKTIYENGKIENEILTHELSHVKQRHTYDILFIQIFQTLFWFNPFLILYKKSIQLNHEFLADEKVINTYLNIKSYQNLLLSKINLSSSKFTLSSQFNYSITKKRLIMMTKTKSFGRSLTKQFAVIPLLALSVFIFSKTNYAQENLTIKEAKKVESTQDGVPQDLIHEYDKIAKKTIKSNGNPDVSKLTDSEVKRLETIYLKMSKKQQSEQNLIFIKSPKPLPRLSPTEKQLNDWNDSKMYGVWIDNKRVDNSILEKYKSVDFAQTFISKLSKNAKNYGKHYYQIDLMTVKEYEGYLDRRSQNKEKYFMAIRSFIK